MTASPSNIESILSAAVILRDGAAKLSFKDFAAALHRTVGADEGYARSVFVPFQNNPAAWLASRNPQSQSEEIVKVILENHFN